MPLRLRRRSLLVAGLATLALKSAIAAEALTVFAAASLTEAMNEIAAAWEAAGHDKPRLSYASSSTLARQIEAGAPVNLFAAADQEWMTYVDRRNLLAPETRRDLLANALVLIVPKDRARRVEIGPGFDLSGLLGAGGRLAVGDPAHVPAGIYAKQALTALGLWTQAEPHLAPAQDVRGALRLVELGEAPAGIVYATDAAASAGIAVAGIFPESSHERITYPFALIRGGDTPEARAFLAFLTGPQARAVFAKRGFTNPE
ncbi:MAG: molybdate ABC transporter substrate-binding protein [Acetobacteraceae bacterium]